MLGVVGAYTKILEAVAESGPCFTYITQYMYIAVQVNAYFSGINVCSIAILAYSFPHSRSGLWIACCMYESVHYSLSFALMLV